MSLQVQVGEKVLENEQVIPLLAQYQLLPRLVQEMIIDQAIATTPDLDCTQEEIQGAVDQFTQQLPVKSEAELKAWFQQNGLQFDQLTAIASRPLMITKFKQRRWGDNLEPYFVERKSQLDRIIYSLIRTDDSGIAQELYFRLLDGEEEFAQLARQYSQGAEAQTGGLVGPVERSVPHPGITQV
ncbi:MAG: peptidylprolyl isomerase, partial [Limnothrix sp.]